MIRLGYPSNSNIIERFILNIKCLKYGGVGALHSNTLCNKDEDCIYLVSTRYDEYSVIDTLVHESVHHAINISKVPEVSMGPINAHALWDGIEYAWTSKETKVIMPLCWYIHKTNSHVVHFSISSSWSGICNFCWKFMTKRMKFRAVEKWTMYCSLQSKDNNGMKWDEVERRLKNAINREYGVLVDCKCKKSDIKSVYKRRNNTYWLCGNCFDATPPPKDYIPPPDESDYESIGWNY